MEDEWVFYGNRLVGYRWRRLAKSNGKIVGASHKSYSSLFTCKINAAYHGYSDEQNPSIFEIASTFSKFCKWDIYSDIDGQWRWKIMSFNKASIIGKSTESYHNKIDCESNAKRNGYRP